RIVGGVVSSEGLWPWQVALLLNDRQVCAGSLIEARWIITAGHCFKGMMIGNLSLTRLECGLRRHSSKRHFERAQQVKRIIVHPKFNGKFVNGDFAEPIDYDIALLELEQPVLFDNRVYPICLPPSNMEEPAGKICYITGWGRNGWRGHRSKFLKQAALPLVSRDQCNRMESYNGQVHKTSLCAGFNDGSVDACQSDSGGPLACQDGGRWYLTGVISWGKQCARPLKYGVYADVRVLGPWIRHVIQDVNKSEM
ncbi:predicted protein, partial [Nematostella vectensis]